jgi:hypothetical protein
LLIARGEKEIQSPDSGKSNRMRRKGAGHKKEVDKQGGLIEKIKKTVDVHTVDDPEDLLL